jgi:DNA excision repair protein ERCC-3
MIEALETHSKYGIPEAISQEIRTLGQRYGLAVIEKSEDGNHLLLKLADQPLAELLLREEPIAPLLGKRLSDTVFQVYTGFRGLLNKN